ncbi:MAG TPA: hypothetical protein VGD58_29355 [Herpetosiphonaceae bacterium]
MEDSTSVNGSATQQLQEIVERAFAEAPMLYANGFVNGLGLTDGYLVLQANGRSIATVNMSLPVIKTLAQSLKIMIESYEREAGQTVPTLDEIQKLA